MLVFFTYQFEDEEQDQLLPEAGEPDTKEEEKFLFVEMTPNDEKRDEIVLTISHLSLEEQQDQSAPKQTSAPNAETTKPPERGKG